MMLNKLRIATRPPPRAWRNAADGSTLQLGAPQRMPRPMVAYLSMMHNEEAVAAVRARRQFWRRVRAVAVVVVVWTLLVLVTT